MKKILASALAILLVACGADNDGSGSPEKQSRVITIAASPAPHAEILSEAAKNMRKRGIDVDIRIFDDYVQPNNVVESGEIQANYMQHELYLHDFNHDRGTHLRVAGRIHYEPLGIYPGKKKQLSELASGDHVGIPNDTTNEARALLLLQDNGLIRLSSEAGLTASVRDVIENPRNLQLVEMEAAQLPRVKDQMAMVILNGNYALAAGFNVEKDAVAFEKSESLAALTYVNVIAVREGHEKDPLIQSLVSELRSDRIREFIHNKYSGAVMFYTEPMRTGKSATDKKPPEKKKHPAFVDEPSPSGSDTSSAEAQGGKEADLNQAA